MNRELLQLAPRQAMSCPRPARRHQNLPGVLDVCVLALASSRCCGTCSEGEGCAQRKQETKEEKRDDIDPHRVGQRLARPARHMQHLQAELL